MDPREPSRPLPDGADCTACGAPVPTGRIRVLARRDDVAFVELDCPACGSEALGILIGGSGPDDPTVLDVAEGGHPTGAAAPARATFRPISPDEAAFVSDHLATWDGDLVGWLDAIGAGGR